MRNLKLFSLLALIALAFASCEEPKVQQDITKLNIIPQPVESKLLTGEFVLNAETKVIISEGNVEATKIANGFAAKIKTAKGFDLTVEAGQLESTLDNEIRFVFSEDVEKYSTEGYSLNVDKNGVVIEAFKPNGMFYAVQTLYQLMPHQIFSSEAIADVELSMPCVEIFDKPRFAWRGNMIDVSRHFHSIEYLKQNLDNLASLKMNKFHWHLTDDQGWRIEIKAYPKLTEIGAWRVDRNDLSWHDRMEQQADEKATYGGFYTQEEIKELIQYAADRYIEIIPEIDIPGHSRAAIASYPEISCDEADYKVATGGIMSENTYCPGKEITFEFTETMLNEVMDLFPSEYMHIGGDECNKDKWKVCDHCQQRKKDEELKDEHELQSYFIKRVEKIINAKGKKMIGWDEILEGGLAPNATVMSWRGTHGGETAAKAGHDVVMSPNSYCYLDLRQGNLDVEPDYGYGRLLLSTAYSYNPVPKEYSKKVAKHILGVQGNLWSESMQTTFDLNYMMFPRLFAIAEVGWTPYEQKDFDDFVRRIEYAFNRLDVMGINYAPSMYNITINHEGGVQSSDLHLCLAAEVNHVDIYYTMDGSEPNTSANLYTDAFPITESCIIKAQAFKDGKAVGRITTKSFDIHKAAGKKVEYHIRPNEKYNTSELSLTDCIRGTVEYSKDYWTAFRGSDVDFQIDLANEEELSNVTVSLMHSTGSWIFLPLNVSCEVSKDGKSWAKIGLEDFSKQAFEPGKYLKEVAFDIEQQQVRYIRIKAKGMKQNPDWHPAKGDDNWIFIDEVIVN
jgi:hexosaminidase